jgi:hypothetical protein
MTRKSKKTTATSSKGSGSEWQENLETPVPIDQSFKPPEQLTEEELSRVNHGAVLTGGIDSTVMLYQLAKTLPKDAEIFPIVLGNGDNTEMLKFLDDLKIKNDIQTFDIDDSDGDETKMLPILEWAEKNRVNVIHFAANYNEALEGIPNKKHDYFQKLNDLSYINCSAPLIGVTKESIIQDAVDIYGIDLSETAQPSQDVRDLKIRNEGFKNAFSVKYNKFIPDPFVTEGTEEEKEEVVAEQEAE